METTHTMTTDINVADTVKNVLDSWTQTDRWFYLVIIILIAVIAVGLWFYSIYSIRATTKDFTEELAKQRSEFLSTMQEQNKLFTEAIYDIKIWRYTTN